VRIQRAELERWDIRTRERMPLTSPPRTLLDLAAEISDERLESLVAEAEYRRLASVDELASQLERNPRKRGIARLRRVLDLPGGPRRTRSPAERALLALLRHHDIKGFETNARVCGYEVDFFFPAHRLVIETDGYNAHSGRVAFERDRLKSATLTANGLAVMHVSGRQVQRDAKGVIGRLLAALGERRPTT